MGRSISALSTRSTARRSAITTVAWQAFLDHGYAGASMSDIATRLGGSKGTLYNYFASKEELFLAVSEERGAAIFAQLAKLPDVSDDVAADLRAFACRMLEVVTSDEYLSFYRLIIAEAERVPVIGRMAYDSRRTTLLAPLCARIEQGMASGQLHPGDPVEATEIFWDLCSAAVNRRALLAIKPAWSTVEFRGLVDRAIAIFLAGFADHPM